LPEPNSDADAITGESDANDHATGDANADDHAADKPDADDYAAAVHSDANPNGDTKGDPDTKASTDATSSAAALGRNVRKLEVTKRELARQLASSLLFWRWIVSRGKAIPIRVIRSQKVCTESSITSRGASMNMSIELKTFVSIRFHS
jgi:hypothetical protein